MSTEGPPRSPQDELARSFRSTIRSGVDSANKALATVQEVTEQVQKPVVQGLHLVQDETQYLAHQARRFYDYRYEYGPYFVFAGAVMVGSVVTMRRGRVPGALAGIATGGVTYVSLYEPFRISELTDTILGRK
jgi:hypothetical protein